MNIKRVFLIVLDSFGVGEMTDAHLFGEVGSNTLKTIAKSTKFNVPNLMELGLSEMDGIDYLGKSEHPKGAVFRLGEKSMGKDTTVGHWEHMGVTTTKAFPTYPNGFPSEVMKAFEEKTGRGTLCNKPYSGTKVLSDYGQEHEKTGKFIVYTSADSVFQIASHESVIPLEELYDACKIARSILTGKHGVGRVIARPFGGEYPTYERTTNRHDFSLAPPKDTLLDCMLRKGLDTIGVGKIYDIFAGKGISETYPTKGNNDGMKKTASLLRDDFHGLCFVNLVDFDMKYGHRNDIDGYAKALSEFDCWLGTFIPQLKDEDLLLITADHGCDPGTESTDHSREFVPLIVYGKNIKTGNFGTRESFADVGKTLAEIFKVSNDLDGASFQSCLQRQEAVE